MRYPLTIAVRLGAEGYSDVNMKKKTRGGKGAVECTLTEVHEL